MRNINADGESKIVQWEGEVLHAYDDFDAAHRLIKVGDRIRGTLTIGVGHTGPDVKPGMVISQEQSRAFLRRDLDAFERVVEQNVKVRLTDNQFAALVSFAFNVGQGNFLKSTLVKKLNKGQYMAVPTELMKWTKSKGITLAGLVNRRAQEAALWGKGEHVTSAAVDTDKDKPNWITPESVGTVVTGATGLSAVAMGSGPFQYALAAVLVIGALVAAGYFIWNRVKK